MEAWLTSSIHLLLAALALPKVGLPAIFVISLVSATLLPVASEPAVFAYVQLDPHLFWPAIAIATAGNTLGGTITYAIGAGAERAYSTWLERHPQAWRAAAGAAIHEPADQPRERPAPAQAGGRWHTLTTRWFERFGPPALLLSWLPVVGDPLCAVAGWLRLPFWPSVGYMAIGKCLRYIALTTALMHAWPWLDHWI